MSDLLQPTPLQTLPAQTVEEVRGVFPDDASLRAAVSALSAAGFARERLIQPDHTIPEGLSTPNEASGNADTEETTRQMRTLGSSTAAAAAALAGAAAVVATGGAALAAVAVAAGAGLAAGGGVLAGTKVGDSATTTERNEAGAAGRLILVATLQGPGEREKAESAMRRAGAIEVTTQAHPAASFSGDTIR